MKPVQSPESESDEFCFLTPVGWDDSFLNGNLLTYLY